MRKILLFILLCWSIGTVDAQSATAPQITLFTSSVNSVDRSSLRDGSSRVPVTWESINRSLVSNLVFEQVLPDGRIVNVELPRPFPWVNSSGSGIAAPVDPGENQSTILLRVRLVNVFTQATLAQRELTLNIVNFTPQPRVDYFAAGATQVDRQQLVAGSARIPVSWNAVNRRLTTNLIFEQVLPDGQVVNVELPRPGVWVNSSGDGVVAPIDPGSSATTIQLRVRLYSFVTGETLDTQSTTLAIQDHVTSGEPQITLFTTNATQVSAAGLLARTELVNVSWDVINRPDNSNLYFEQVLEDGQLVNVELPRDFQFVGSTGSGVVAPVRPSDNATNTITLRVVLRSLSTGVDYDEAQITLPISGSLPNVSINSFTVTPSSAVGGDTLTLSWNVSGVNSVSIMVVYYGLRFGWVPFEPDQMSLDAVGSATFTAPEGVREISIILTADLLSETLEVSLDCAIGWVSGSNDVECPSAEVRSIQAAYQPFEGGYMIWREDSDMIWIYINSSQLFVVRPDTYAGGEIVFDEPAPEGRVQPINGFGKVWIDDAWIRDSLGWALAAEQGYTMSYQESPIATGTNGSRYRVFTLPDGTFISARIGAF